MTTILTAVMWIGFPCVITTPIPPGHQQSTGRVRLLSEFVAEPDTIQRMRIGDACWVPAHGLVIDKDGMCWIKKHQKLDEDSLHMIQVFRFHDKGHTNRAIYGIRIERSRLHGWMWQLGDYEGKYYEATGHLAVSSLQISE